MKKIIIFNRVLKVIKESNRNQKPCYYERSWKKLLRALIYSDFKMFTFDWA